MRRLSLLLPLLIGCNSNEPTPVELSAAAAGEVIATDDHGSYLRVRQPVVAESDQTPSVRLVRQDALTKERRDDLGPLRGAYVTSAGLLVITPAGDLERVTGAGRKHLLSRAFGAPTVLSEDRIVVAQRKDDPTESDLVLIQNGKAQELAPAPGPDETPISVSENRVVFVSGRTGLASLWIVDVRDGVARQLTNVGRTVVDSAFVPPPVRDLHVGGQWLAYDAGQGARWRVDWRTGVAEREAGP